MLTFLKETATKTLLVGCDIVTLGDLVQDKVTENGHVREWLSKETLDGAGLKGIHSVLRRCPLPTGDITIRVGSCLCLEGSADVLEFLGWVDDLACVRRWSPVSRIDNCSVNSRYKISEAHRSRGAGSDELLDPSLLLTKSKRVLMSPDKVVGRSTSKQLGQTRVVEAVEARGTSGCHVQEQ